MASFTRLAALAFLAAAAPALAKEPSLAQVKAAAEKYRNVKAAIADGYTTDGMCTDARMLGFPASQGGMGLHYVRKDLIGMAPKKPGKRVTGTERHTDFLKPSMLVYEPQPHGPPKLVAVENLVFHSAWHAAGHKRPPTFHGVPYVLLKDDPKTKLDEAHGFEAHYELHLWVFRDNPTGMFREFNPKVTCRFGKRPPGHK